jgi:hypothetical protein
MSRTVAFSGDLYGAYQQWRRPGNMSTHPALDAERVLDLEELRPVLLRFRQLHQQFVTDDAYVHKASPSEGECPGCTWCELSQPWRDWAEA